MSSDNSENNFRTPYKIDDLSIYRFESEHGLDALIQHCDKRSLVHASRGTVSFYSLIAVIAVFMGIVAFLVFRGPLELKTVSVTVGNTTTTTQESAPASSMLISLVTILTVFLGGVVSYQLRTRSRWDDYVVALLRIRIATLEEHQDGDVNSLLRRMALLGAPFESTQDLKSIDFAAIQELLKKLSRK